MTDPRLLAEHYHRTGEIICQICCESKKREDMEPVSDDPSKVWDICKECAEGEKQHGGQF